MFLPPDSTIMETPKSIVEPDSKIEYILKAAQNRLGLYGYEKTTMQEIASDIAMSKASLYYYFPDKESLFRAVIENEQNEYFQLLEQRIAGLSNADRMVMELVELRQMLFRKFLNLGKFRLADNHKMKPLLKDLYNKMREKEIEVLTTIFDIGKSAGIFYYEDSAEVAHLFSDMLQGIRIMEMKKMSSLEMTLVENDHLIKSINLATTLFINGLKFNTIFKATQS
jgi:AcrR family transcriptional regulator